LAVARIVVGFLLVKDIEESALVEISIFRSPWALGSRGKVLSPEPEFSGI
jgi:hypothetical protein